VAGQRSLQRNAADPAQVRFAARKEQRSTEMLLGALAEVLTTATGRLVWAEFLERAGLYESSFDHSGSVVYFKEGRRNMGLEWQALLVQADEELYDLLERERRQRKRQLDQEIQANQMQNPGNRD
jgi:hypothetical protein